MQFTRLNESDPQPWRPQITIRRITRISTKSNERRTKARVLLSILELEQKQGYANSAVAGGLDRFLFQWRREAGDVSPGDPALSTDLILHEFAANKLFAVPYGELPPKRRKAWVRIALACLRKEEKPPIQALRVLFPTQPVTMLRGVTARVVPALKRLGVETIGDLIHLYPRRHNEVRNVAELRLDEDQTIKVNLWNASEVRLGKTMRGTEAAVGDNTGNIRVIWFNQPYLAKTLKAQNRYVLSGRVTMHGRRRVLESPQYEEIRSGEGLEELVTAGRLFPVYPGTEGLTQRTTRRVVREALTRALGNIPDPLPEKLRERHGMLPIRKALWDAHYPDGWENSEEARRRIAFEELLTIQLAVLSRRQATESETRPPVLKPGKGILEAFITSLPFNLTGAQLRVLEEVLSDLGGGVRPMTRLLQGDVGSGKTVVALAALLVAATAGYQGAIMAPTEILAEQHFLTVSRLLEGLADPLDEEFLFSVLLPHSLRPITVGLLLGSMTTATKRKIRSLLSNGTLDIAIGTHALIQEDVEIPRLALAVVDEQHRFGVMQRATLRHRGESPHLLVMSATPIPRTLALTLYGDLDLSTIGEIPPGRQTIKTKWVQPEHRSGVYQFLRNHVAEGRQVFAVYPLIDESEAINARAAVKEKERLSRDVFPEMRVGLLHGRMSLKEKQEVMEMFRNGKLDILVSTPVVEVGIDVPNATVMLIEGADRFGLSQLHQFRGRVGRGEHASYCILMSESPSEDAERRLSAMERLDDGFKLAEADLELRGPGEFFGTRQSGLPDLRMARISDHELLTLARAEAQDILAADPHLTSSENHCLAEALTKLSKPAMAEVG